MLHHSPSEPTPADVHIRSNLGESLVWLRVHSAVNDG